MARIIKSNLLTSKKVGIKNAYEIFLRHKKSLCAKSTYDIYAEIGERHIIPMLERLTDDDMNSIDADVLRLMLAEYEEDHTNGGVLFFYRHLKAFVNWYWEEYEIETPNPAKSKKFRVKKSATPPKKGITQEEVDKLLKTAKERSVFPERDIAMIMLLCDTGIRRSSLANLTMGNVNLNRSEIVVYEKDQLYHTKAFGQATAKAVRKYMNCLADIKPSDPFWLSLDGTSLTWQGLREILRRLCTEAKIPVHHFHDFRRYYGLELYNSTHDIYLVSRALDHKDIEVTKRYLAIDDQEAAETARSHSPMDKRLRQTGVKIIRK